MTLSVSDSGGGAGSATITVGDRSNALSITKTANTSEVIAGQEIQYTITYNNTGTGTYNHLSLEDDYDESHLEIVSIPSQCSDSGGKLSCSVASLDSGATGSLSYTMKAKELP